MPRGGGSGGLRPCRARRRRPDGSRRRPKGNQTHVFLAAANKPPPHNLPQTATPPDHLAASDEIKEQRPTRPTCTGKQKRGRFLPSRRAASCWDKRLGYGATFRPEDSNGHKKKCWSSMFHLFVSLLGCSPARGGGTSPGGQTHSAGGSLLLMRHNEDRFCVPRLQSECVCSFRRGQAPTPRRPR